MAIIQISRIIQRSGNLVDLPQLAEAELGWANDARRLFVGRGAPYDSENVEVLTSYSSISFGQLEGSYGNLNFTNPVEGQIISYNVSANAWVNTGGNAADPGNTSQYSNNLVHLGDVDNVKLGGGSIGYVLETDGQGNLAWASKGTLRNPIFAISNATPVVIQIEPTTPYVNGLELTITGANATNANTVLNGQNFYVSLSPDFSISGNLSLYTDSGLSNAVNGSTLSNYVPNSGIATALLSSATSGAVAGGIEGSIQFNKSGFANGVAALVWNTTTSLLAVTGNSNISGTSTVGALSATGVVRGSQIISTVANPTPPLIVTSSTRVANANVETAGNLINGTSNVTVTANSNIAMSVGNNANILVVTTSGISVTGNANIGNIGTSGLITATGPVTANYFISSNSLNGYYLANAGITVGKIYENGNIIKLQAELANYGVALASNGSVRLQFDANGYGGVGDSGTTGYALRIAKQTTGATTAGSILINPTVQTDVTSVATGVRTSLSTAVGASPYTITNLVGYATYGGTIGANTTVTNQIAYYVDSNATGGTNNWGFYGGLASAASTFNLYMQGTANNYIAGRLGIGTTSPTAPLHVKQNGSLVNLEGTDHAYIQFYPRGIATRTSWIGIGVANSNNFTVRNDDTGRLSLESGNSNISVFANGNVTTSVAGSANILVVTNTGANINGTLNITGNTTTNAITTGSNITAGTITGNWTLTTGSRLQATYADLAEYYESDSDYLPGTVLEFGGDQEVTLAQKETTRVAGVVSTNPAYAMNSNCQGIAVAIALQGRVPTKVCGKVYKGDMMVSAGNGYAKSSLEPKIGTIIGKALENFDGEMGIIEIAVGRL
jgi:hypothetical protein